MRTTQNNKPAIVLVHGLWLRPWFLNVWKKFLRSKGFVVYSFGYASSSKPFAHNVQHLVAFVNSRPESTVHIVAHSMGSLLSIAALEKINKTGKLVMLGSPVNGSSVANALKRLKWDRYLTRHASQILSGGLVSPNIDRPSLMLAGDRPLGIGRIFGTLKKANDGTVSVDETQADWITEHRILHTSHMGLLKNKEAQVIALSFLLNDSPQDKES